MLKQTPFNYIKNELGMVIVYVYFLFLFVAFTATIQWLAIYEAGAGGQPLQTLQMLQ